MGKLVVKIKSNYEKMSKQEKKISDFLLSNSQESKILTVTELSRACNVSEATIVRYAKGLGFNGFIDFKVAFANESKSVTSISLTENDGLKDVYSKICDDIYSSLISTKEGLSEEKLRQCYEILEEAENIGIYGVGSSGCVAGDVCHKLLRLGFNVQALSDSHMQTIHACVATEKSAIILLTHSGATKDIIEAGKIAKSRGAKIIVVTSNDKSPLVSLADVCFLTTSRETNYRLLGLTSRYASLAIFDTLHEYIILHDEKRKSSVISVEDVTMLKRLNRRKH